MPSFELFKQKPSYFRFAVVGAVLAVTSLMYADNVVFNFTVICINDGNNRRSEETGGMSLVGARAERGTTLRNSSSLSSEHKFKGYRKMLKSRFKHIKKL